MRVRRIVEADWPEILSIQNEIYAPEVVESEQVLRSKYEFSPTTCLVCADMQGALVAYCLAYPYPQDGIPELGAITTKISETANLFVHDLAVRNSSRGRGIAKQLFSALREIALRQNFSSLSLVALPNAIGFWEKMGLQKASDQNAFSGYGPGACSMVASI